MILLLESTVYPVYQWEGSKALVLPATMVLLRMKLPVPTLLIPPPSLERFKTIVLLLTVAVLAKNPSPRPFEPVAVLFEMVTLTMVNLLLLALRIALPFAFVALPSLRGSLSIVTSGLLVAAISNTRN